MLLMPVPAIHSPTVTVNSSVRCATSVTYRINGCIGSGCLIQPDTKMDEVDSVFAVGLVLLEITFDRELQIITCPAM